MEQHKLLVEDDVHTRVAYLGVLSPQTSDSAEGIKSDTV